MKPIKINQNSWHFKLVREANQWDMPEDICAYTRRLLGMLALLMFLFVIGSLLIFMLGSALGWMAYCIAWLDIVPPDVNAMCGAILIFLMLCGAARFLYERHATPSASTYEPGFVRAAWRHFHEKTCAKLEFSEDA